MYYGTGSHDDSHFETDDPEERFQQRTELKAHMARCREQEAKRHASMARVGKLVQHDSVADALVPALVRHLATLRALACTCRVWRARVLAHFESLARLDLRSNDATEGNAAFVFGPLLVHRPDIRVVFVHEDDDGVLRGYSRLPRGLKKWMDNRRKRGRWIIPKCGTGDVISFFLSRAVAKIPELRLVLPRERDEARRKRPIVYTCRELSTYRSSSDNCADWEFRAMQSKLAHAAFEIVAGCHLVAALQSLDRPAWLENSHLDLSYLHLDDEGARTVVSKMRKKGVLAKRILLRGTLSRGGSLGLLGVLANNSASTGEACVDVGCLESLSITTGRLWETRPFDALCTLLRRSSLTKLTHLNLANSRMGARNMREFAKHFQMWGSLQSLETLNLFANNLGMEGLDAVRQCARVMPKLLELEIGLNYISPDAEASFLHWIGSEAQWPCIKSVRMSLTTVAGRMAALANKTCLLARERCKWEQLLAREANYDEGLGTNGSDVQSVREGQTTSEESDDMTSTDEEPDRDDDEEEEEEEEEDHDE